MSEPYVYQVSIAIMACIGGLVSLYEPWARVPLYNQMVGRMPQSQQKTDPTTNALSAGQYYEWYYGVLSFWAKTALAYLFAVGAIVRKDNVVAFKPTS